MFWTTLGGTARELTDLLQYKKRAVKTKTELVGGEQEDFFSGVCDLHPVERLPREFAGLPNGHGGSHQFLVDDFVRSVVQRRLAPNHVWAAARYTIPGIVAHESAKKEGEQLKITDFGDPPVNCKYVTYDA
jgi:hypothetical protein